MMHHHQCCTQKPFNPRKINGARFWPSYLPTGGRSHTEKQHLGCVAVQFFIILQGTADKQAFCVFFFLSNAGPGHIYEA